MVSKQRQIYFTNCLHNHAACTANIAFRCRKHNLCKYTASKTTDHVYVGQSFKSVEFNTIGKTTTF